jgi:hypothetical protein
VRIHLSHWFDAAVRRVQEAMLDPAFEAQLVDLPSVAEREVIEVVERPDGTARRVVHYRFGGSLPSIVRRTIGGDTISWDEICVVGVGLDEWRIDIRPKIFAAGFDARGAFTFKPDDDGCLRELRVDLKVKVPVVGGRVERVIAEGLTDSVEAEARLLTEYLEA